MSDITLAVGDDDAGLRDRLDEEISAFNAAATGHHDGLGLSIAVRGDDRGLRAGLTGWTWGGCGYTGACSAACGLGAMFWLSRNRFAGSYRFLSATSRWYLASP